MTKKKNKYHTKRKTYMNIDKIDKTRNTFISHKKQQFTRTDITNQRQKKHTSIIEIWHTQKLGLITIAKASEKIHQKFL